MTASASPPPRPPDDRVPVAGVGVSQVDYASMTAQVMTWAQARESRYVCVCSAHGIVDAQVDPALRQVLNQADAVTPDGTPVAWVMRAKAGTDQPRVYGPDLMLAVCRAAAAQGVSIYLYGATEATLDQLEANLTERFPGLVVAGREAPPFRPPTEEEDAATVASIRDSGAGVVFMGLSSPKQDHWMAAHRGRVPAVMIGVGAAFDFHAGGKVQAPPWVGAAGLEWLFRCLTEPARLVPRYARVVPRFMGLALVEALGLAPDSAPADRRPLQLAALGAAAILAGLAWMGQPWVCARDGLWPLWFGAAYSPHTSQHLLDPYSFTHLLHGFLFWWGAGGVSWLRGKLGGGPLGKRWAFCLAVLGEGLWELVENSPTVIERYRANTAALQYSGDSVLNSAGDLLCCATGLLLAAALGGRRALAVFLVTEAFLLWWIRDCLLLNIVMLVHPIEALKTWQAAGLAG